MCALDCEKSFPARVTIQLNLGDVYRDMGRAKEARERYQHFLEMDREDAVIVGLITFIIKVVTILVIVSKLGYF